MKHVSIAIVVSLAFGLFLAGGATASDLAQGEELYTSQCQLCHGSLKQEADARATNPSGGHATSNARVHAANNRPCFTFDSAA